MEIMEIYREVINYLKDTKHNPDYKSKKSHLLTKLFYLFLLFYFLMLGILGLFNDRILIPVLLFLIFLIGIAIMIGDIFYYLGKRNTFFSKADYVYGKFHTILLRVAIRNKKQKIPKKIAVKRTIYMFWFFIIPMFFLGIIIMGQWRYAQGSGAVSGSFQSGTAYNAYRNDGIVLVSPIINKDYITQLSYVIGNLLDMPILDICFINNGTTFESDTNNNSFMSQVIINNITYDVPYRGRFCEKINIKNQEISYQWITQYQHSIKNRIAVNGTINLTSNPFNNIEVNINDNFLIMAFLILIGWIGVSHLLYNVFKDFQNIGKDKDE